MSFLKKQLRRFGFAQAGIRYAVRTDKSFRLQWYGIGSIVVAALYLLAPLSVHEFLLIMLAYFLILITELQNSALEYALDHLHPETHDNIGRSKDMAAGAVLLAGLFLVMTLGALLFVRLF
jgi:diacylglycerol kinase